MELLVNRTDLLSSCTFGDLLIDDTFECLTLEDTVREVPGQSVAQWKIPEETAIPYGRYQVIWDYSNRFKRKMLHILNVDGFGGIRIHSGNTAANTEGCIIVGDKRNGNTIHGGKANHVLERLEAKVCKAIEAGEKVYITIKKFEENLNDTDGM